MLVYTLTVSSSQFLFNVVLVFCFSPPPIPPHTSCYSGMWGCMKTFCKTTIHALCPSPNSLCKCLGRPPWYGDHAWTNEHIFLLFKVFLYNKKKMADLLKNFENKGYLAKRHLAVNMTVLIFCYCFFTLCVYWLLIEPWF